MTWKATGAADLPLADRGRAWDQSAAEKRVRSWAGDDWGKYGRAFFAHDTEKAEQVTGYKLQFADVVDGELQAVPRAIFAVAAVLMGSRGGVDLPEDVQAAVKGKVAAYYHKIEDGLKAPWEQAKSLRSVQIVDDSEDGLRVGGYGMLWGDPEHRDAYGTYFVPDANYWDDKISSRFVLYDHGFDNTLKASVLGDIVLERDDERGRWVEAQLANHAEYLDWIRPLLQQNALSWSTGAVAHLADFTDGKATSWPIVEYSLTTAPAEPRMALESEQLQVIARSAPSVRSFVSTEAASEVAIKATSEAAAQQELSQNDVKDVNDVNDVKDVNMNTQEETTMAEIDIDALVKQATDSAVKAAVEALRKETPPETKGNVSVDKVADTRSFGNFLLSVRRGNTKRLKEVYHAVRADMAESAGVTGGYLVPAEFVPQVLQVAAENAIVRPRAYIQPMKARSLTIPMLNQTTQPSSGSTYFFGGLSASWTEEGAAKTETEPVFKQLELVAHKLAGYTQASDELLADSAVALESLLVRLFGGAVAWIEDYNFLRGNGVGKPLGVLNSPALLTVARNTASDVKLADINGMMAKFLPSSWGKGVWLCNITTFPKIAILADAAGNQVFIPNIQGPSPGTIYGMPLIFTEKLPALGTEGDVLLADFSYYVIGDRQALSIQSSTDYAFINDLTTWRFVHRVDGQPWLDAPIYLQDASNQVSPFVALTDAS